jgi:uncharacterized membrane protein
VAKAKILFTIENVISFVFNYREEVRPMRRSTLFAAAMLVATIAFWAVMFTSPPISEAGAIPGIDIRKLTLAAQPEMAESYDAF